MKINKSIHLCYSLNIFPRSEYGFLQNIEQIAKKFCEIRKDLELDKETLFALGLWLDADAVEELNSPAKLAELKTVLKQNSFYVFTVNAFPYGQFHDGPIKENVYLPNWTSDLRKDFTCRVADILAELLPEGLTGSISTIPGGYREHLNGENAKIANNLIETADHLAAITRRNGKEIILGVEMEPDCIWETPQEFCEFRKKFLTTKNAEKYIGVCYDTCHQELLEGAPGSGIKFLQSQNIPIAKIQLSAALQGNANKNAELFLAELAQLADPVYLHQIRFFDKDGQIVSAFKDIPDFEASDAGFLKKADSVCIHFHMPLYSAEITSNYKVANCELRTVLDLIKKEPSLCSNLEIETYTYKVLPDEIKAESTEQMIADEYRWVIKTCSYTDSSKN